MKPEEIRSRLVGIFGSTTRLLEQRHLMGSPRVAFTLASCAVAALLSVSGASSSEALRFHGPPDGQAAGYGGIRGQEFAAALNLKAADLKFQVQLWVPGSAARLRAVFVILEYGMGYSLYVDPALRKWSDAEGVGLLALQVTRITGPAIIVDADADVAGGLLQLIRQLASESGQSEVSNSPLVFWGHSSAGRFGTTFSATYPERTVAFVRYHSGSAGADNLPSLDEIPGLFIVGGKDEVAARGGPSAQRNAQDLWERGRGVAAPWTLAFEPLAVHADFEDVKRAHTLVLPWLAAVIRQRVAGDGSPLRVIGTSQGWSGNIRTGEITPYSASAASRLDTAWLPDEATAQTWRAQYLPGR